MDTCNALCYVLFFNGNEKYKEQDEMKNSIFGFKSPFNKFKPREDKQPEEKNMARNLVREQEEKKEDIKFPEYKNEKKDSKEDVANIRIITENQLIINNLQILLDRQEQMYLAMLKGFKQVGVTFDDKD